MSTTTHLIPRTLAALVATVLTTGTLTAAGTTAGHAAEAHTTFANPAPIEGRDMCGGDLVSTPISVGPTGTPNGSVYPSTVIVSGVSGTTAMVWVHLYLAHGAPEDLDILLVDPTGTAVPLMSDAGGAIGFDGHLQFTTSATTPLPESGPLADGNYVPANYDGNDSGSTEWPAPAPAVADPHATLDAFLGHDPNGTWQLFVRDDHDGNGGIVSSWSLSICSSNLPPAPAATYPAPLPVSGLPGTVTDVDVRLYGVSWFEGEDLGVLVQSPDGRRAVLMSGTGGHEAIADADIVLDDEAPGILPADTAVLTGTYRPTDTFAEDTFFPAPAPAGPAGTSLSVFDGADPNGTWHLWVVDTVAENFRSGEIAGGWSLTLTTTDVIAPRIRRTFPRAGAHAVRRGVTVTAKASEDLDPATVSSATAYLKRAGSTRRVRAAVSYLAQTRTIVVDPAHRLRAGTRYRVVVTTQVRDLAGNRLDQKPGAPGLQRKTWRFTTRSRA